MARMCLEATSDRDWRPYAPVLASIELLNISTYQSNYCFDEKAGVSDGLSKSNQFISSMLTLCGAIALVDDCPDIAPETRGAIKSLIASVNAEVYSGQFMDLNILAFDRATDFADRNRFLTHYFRRCDLIAGSTFGACVAAAMGAGAEERVIVLLDEYLRALGAATQIINDLGDYIPFRTKDYAVPGSDLMLGRLTFPAYVMITSGLPLQEWRETACTSRAHDGPLQNTERAIRELNIEGQVRQLVKLHYFPRIRRSIKLLSRALGEDKTAPLSFAYPYIYDSRLLRYFRDDNERTWNDSAQEKHL